MERKKYLQLCQQHAAGWDVMVYYNSRGYYPKAYILSFDKFGNPIHSAVLIEKNDNRVLQCKLDDIKEENK